MPLKLGSQVRKDLRRCLRGEFCRFDARAGIIWARLMAEGKAVGRQRSGLDMILAAVAEANDCIVATDNEKDFSGLDFFNPLRNETKGEV